MPADNGIYILKTPAPPIKNGESNYINQHGKFEYRVAHCQAIKDLDYSDLYMPILFGDSEVYLDLDFVYRAARNLYHKMEEENDGFFLCEYGICEIHHDKYFPNITARAAAVALNCYVGAIPLDVQ